MAENENGQEKTEEPTAKRLQDTKRKGQIARSKELNTMAITLIGGIALVAMSSHMGDSLSQIMSGGFTLSREEIFDPASMLQRLVSSIQDALLMLAPFFLVILVIAIASSVALGGMAVSAESLTPKFSKLNPIKGLKKLFSVTGLVEMLKAMAKFILVAGATMLVLRATLGQFINLSEMELSPAIAELTSLIGGSFILIASTLIIIAMIDVPFQLWNHKKQLRMTRQEIKEEMKESEGRPEVKGRIRNLQREAAMRRMMEEVPKADVIVTNPTHYAVALRYDQNSMHAPKLVAKGADLVAANIRKLAAENQVPVVESPMLARAVYFHTELNEFIPAGLFLAVARLLAYVFQLKVYYKDGGMKPEPPTGLQVPEELQVPETGK